MRPPPGFTRLIAAQRIGATASGINDALSAPRPDIAMARCQALALREAADDALRELDAREHGHLDAADVVEKVARTYRAFRGVGEHPTRQAALLARSLDACARLAVGMSPVGGFDPNVIEEIRLAIRAKGVGAIALAHWAIACPDLAAQMDRPSLDKLVIAWTAGVEEGRWPAIAAVWRDRFGVSVEPASIKREVRKLAR